ncbi:hypothetical protein ECG_05229 [Echinococcus granulosus]|nr:hypothetical protein ECG_05229 [Echinococcus granulosus]
MSPRHKSAVQPAKGEVFSQTNMHLGKHRFTTLSYCVDDSSVPKSTPVRPPKRKGNAGNRQEFSKKDLDDILTPAYYGDEEDVVDDQKNSGEDWVLFSTRNEQLLLKGPHGTSYPMCSQYKVEIEGHVFTGNPLSELIRNVQKGMCGTEEAKQRKCVSLIYHKDLRHFAGFKEIAPVVKEESVETIGKGEFGEVTLGLYPERIHRFTYEFSTTLTCHLDERCLTT